VLVEQLRQGRSFTRVVVMAPAHRVAFSGIAVPDCHAFTTPLGTVPLWSGCEALARHRPFVLDSRPHAEEHAVEVHLPFLQCILKQFELVPLVFGMEHGQDPTEQLVELVDDHTLFVVSSDLSHYLPYEQARKLDEVTLGAFQRMDPVAVAQSEACGRAPAATMFAVARKLHWNVQLLDCRNSGDTAGDKHRVVGYAALALSSPTA
jgi:AmmeMemoRadiSam system protein B